MVHGINNTYGGPEMMAAAWAPALLDGLILAGHSGALPGEDTGCAFCGDLFRAPGRFLGSTTATGLDDGESTEDEAGLLAAWWQVAAESDPTVFPPTIPTCPGRRVRHAGGVAALANSRFMAGAAELALTLWISQVRRYFTDPDLRPRVQARVAETITAGTLVVVGHSLGRWSPTKRCAPTRTGTSQRSSLWDRRWRPARSSSTGSDRHLASSTGACTPPGRAT